MKVSQAGAPLSPPTVMAKAVQPPLLKAQEVVVQVEILVTDMVLFLSSGCALRT